jgi:hypothetical protein
VRQKGYQKKKRESFGAVIFRTTNVNVNEFVSMRQKFGFKIENKFI